MRCQFMFVMACCAGGLLAACDPGGPEQDEVEVTPTSRDVVCRNQRAMVPRSLSVASRVDRTNSMVQRNEDASYVAYQVTSDDLFAYFSFTPDLPARPTTDLVRGKLTYAYVTFRARQPAALGGSLTLLSGNDLLALTDFARFEVVDGQLHWRLARQSADHYDKVLSIYDQDPSNDPGPSDICRSDDIVGLCACEFTGPVVSVTIEGATPL
jgi:hypothetical protein